MSTFLGLRCVAAFDGESLGAGSAADGADCWLCCDGTAVVDDCGLAFTAVASKIIGNTKQVARERKAARRLRGSFMARSLFVFAAGFVLRILSWCGAGIPVLFARGVLNTTSLDEAEL